MLPLSRQKSGFNFIARFYDALVLLIFRKKLKSIIEKSLTLQPSKPKRILVVGCGTASNLTTWFKAFPDSNFTLLDFSEEMLKHAKNNMASKSVTLMCADFLAYQSSELYDLILFPFFLSCFNREKQNQLVAHTQNVAAKEASLILCDFNQKSNSKWFSGLMLWFFNAFTHLQLKAIESPFQNDMTGWRIDKEENLGYLSAASYKRELE